MFPLRILLISPCILKAPNAGFNAVSSYMTQPKPLDSTNSTSLTLQNTFTRCQRQSCIFVLKEVQVTYSEVFQRRNSRVQTFRLLLLPDQNHQLECRSL